MKERILIVEDEALIVEELKIILTDLNYEVVGYSSNGDRALDLLAKSNADLVLLDINIKGTLSGIDIAEIIRKRYNIPFVYVTSFTDDLTLRLVKETSPYGFVVKPFNEVDLKVSIQLAFNQFRNEVTKKEFTKNRLEEVFDIKITNREFDVLFGLKKGFTYREISEQLSISINTVKSYQKKVFQMFQVQSKYELIEKIRI